MVDIERAVRHAVASLGRTIVREQRASTATIVQLCAICDVELRLWDVHVASYDVLFRRMFAFYDAHVCHGLGRTLQQAYERAEAESLRMAARARALQDRERTEAPGELPSLFERAEREAIALAAAASVFRARLAPAANDEAPWHARACAGAGGSSGS